MSETIAGLERKIASAGELRSVVRSMKALAAASIGQYERSVRALADYARAVDLGLGACLRALGPERRVAPAKPGAVVAVVFGSDQGLVGSFNEAIADYAVHALPALPGAHQIWAVGDRIHARLTDAGLPMAGVFPVPNSVNAITPLVGQILTDCAAHQRLDAGGEVQLFYNGPTAGAAYAPVQRRLLPLDDQWRRDRVALRWPTRHVPEVMGDATDTLRSLIREYLFVSLFRACAESLASENASRLAAMERADRNIDDLLDDLNRKVRRQRQTAIDEELFDVIAGAEALSHEGRSSG